ncbi:hypothetical protein BD410DRAFT_835108 [Rickenella mellea]|uniref:Uncharacterized protein n=1 Tax=Rickenella mellea TaxID=50990 RepID=A0A4Y7QJI5_9AGAM|nr:hypothetical protein BD410DRAFT_835108 [Rickenella mellea]
MLIRLLPIAPLPTVLFNVSFPALPETLPFPAGWANQLHLAAAHDLELPTCVHALDKSGWALSLVHEVTFHMERGVVECVWVDGTRDEWGIGEVGQVGGDGGGCVRALERVLEDVEGSAKAGEWERAMEAGLHMPTPTLPPTIVQQQAAATATAQQHPPVSGRPRHKKQRSLLMTLVASLVPSSLTNPSSTSLPPSTPSAPAPAPSSIPTPSAPPHSSRFYRRRARATLVDTYRRYILPVLTTRFRPSIGAPGTMTGNGVGGGYCLWIAKSMLRRVEGRMMEIAQEDGFPRAAIGVGGGIRGLAGRGLAEEQEGAIFFDDFMDCSSEEQEGRRETGLSPTSTVSSSSNPFLDDDESYCASMTTMDTDDSSSLIHTPADSRPGSRSSTSSTSSTASTGSSISATSTGNTSSPHQPIPRSPTPPSPTHPTSTSAATTTSTTTATASYAEYLSLSTHLTSLRALIREFKASERALRCERREVAQVLEVKSRRRAWLGCELRGGARVWDRGGGIGGGGGGDGYGGTWGVGLGVPVVRSPLGRCEVVNAGDLEEEEGEEEEEEEEGEGERMDGTFGIEDDDTLVMHGEDGELADPFALAPSSPAPAPTPPPPPSAALAQPLGPGPSSTDAPAALPPSPPAAAGGGALEPFVRPRLRPRWYALDTKPIEPVYVSCGGPPISSPMSPGGVHNANTHTPAQSYVAYQPQRPMRVPASLPVPMPMSVSVFSSPSPSLSPSPAATPSLSPSSPPVPDESEAISVIPASTTFPTSPIGAESDADEFTLALDVKPFTPGRHGSRHGHGHGHGRSARRHSSSSMAKMGTGVRYEKREWLGLKAVASVVDCH